FAAGLKAGDVIERVGTVNRPDQDAFIAYLRGHVGRPIPVTVSRAGRTFVTTLTPVLSVVPGERPRGRVGIELGQGSVLTRQRVNPVVALGRGARAMWDLTVQLVKSLGAVFGPAAIGRIFHLLGGAPRQV